jgi:hypothetical protein
MPFLFPYRAVKVNARAAKKSEKDVEKVVDLAANRP